MALTCPACSQPMIEVEETAATVDVCSACNGVWFDADELQTKGIKLRANLLDASGPQRQCPRCAVALKPRDADIVVIDECPRCRGVYLDAGEIESLVALGDQAAARPAAEPASSPGDRFLCDLCRTWTPMAERTVGRFHTVCPGCAQREDIKHDPAARKRADAAQRRMGSYSYAVIALPTFDHRGVDIGRFRVYDGQPPGLLGFLIAAMRDLL